MKTATTEIQSFVVVLTCKVSGFAQVAFGTDYCTWAEAYAALGSIPCLDGLDATVLPTWEAQEAGIDGIDELVI